MANQKTVPIQSRLDKNTFNKLRILAEQRGLSISLMVRLLLLKNFEGQNDKDI